ncbi:MAG: hypothetical protein K2F79_05035, partial [Muribaculaceae bacterium]|nr:hypothetical protein [Muribaculaceae bacterium]
MNSIYRNIILTAAAAAAFTAQAQDLSTEITVDRTIRPQEHTAAPLQSVKPQFIRPSAPKTDIRPTEYTLLTPYKPTAGTAGDYSYNGLSLPADFRGYVRAGYFPAYNLGFDMGYRILDGKTDRLGVAASFEGQSHNSH